MLFFYIAAVPLVACTVLAAALVLPSKTTGWFVRLDVGLAWFAALATLILVPTDVATTLEGNQPGYLSAWWLASYWYGFVVQVLVLPVHMEFTRSGEFSILDRLVGSIRSNLIYYAILLAVGLVGLLLLLLTGHLKASNVVGFCIAFSNAYGLIAGIFLLGFGLVSVPKQLWKCADLHGELKRLEHQAGAQAERATEAHRRLSVAVLTARKASVLFANHDPMRPYMDKVLALANSVGPTFRPVPNAEVADESEMDYFDKYDLARLRRQVKACLKDYEREKALYVEAVESYLSIEEVLVRLDSGQTSPAGASLGERLLWIWRCHLHYWVFRFSAVLCALLSLGIVIAEGTISDKLPNLSFASWALRRVQGAGQFATEALCLLCLAYPCACAYYSIYRLGQFSFYRLVPRHTDAYSLCYSALLMTRFAPPLAFNFMAAIALPQSSGGAGTDVTNTVFYRIFGQLMMRQPLIGFTFTSWAPAALVPYMLLLILGVFNPLVGGVSSLFKRSAKLTFEDDWANDSQSSGGRRLLRMEGENKRNGLPLGLTIEPGGGEGGAGVAAVAEQHGLLGGPESAPAPWWRRLLGKGGTGTDPAAPGARASRHSAEAEEARSRLSRALGRGGAGAASRGSPGRGGGGGGAGRGASGGVGTSGGGAMGRAKPAAAEDYASPTRRLLGSEDSESEAGGARRGPSRSDEGDIFSRLDEGGRSERHVWRNALGAPGEGGPGNRSSLGSVEVESVESSEDIQSRPSWLSRLQLGRKK